MRYKQLGRWTDCLNFMSCAHQQAKNYLHERKSAVVPMLVIFVQMTLQCAHNLFPFDNSHLQPTKHPPWRSNPRPQCVKGLTPRRADVRACPPPGYHQFCSHSKLCANLAHLSQGSCFPHTCVHPCMPMHPWSGFQTTLLFSVMQFGPIPEEKPDRDHSLGLGLRPLTALGKANIRR